MRQSQNKNRMRGRGRKQPNPLSRNYESNGPDVKIRGNAAHIAEKYSSLARDALSSGDRVMAENYLQHAEHYNRILAAANAQMSALRGEEPGQAPRVQQPGFYDDDEDGEGMDPSGSDNEQEAGPADVQPASDTGEQPRMQPKEPREMNGRRERRERNGSGQRQPRGPRERQKDDIAAEAPEGISQDAAGLPASLVGFSRPGREAVAGDE